VNAVAGDPDGIRLTASWLPVSAEQIRDYDGLLLDEMTRHRNAADREQARQAAIERAAEQQVQADQHALLLASATGLHRAVLEMHGPVLEPAYHWPVCNGCDFDGYEGEPPEWPCSTYILARDTQG
jgi:hypothetical protein